VSKEIDVCPLWVFTDQDTVALCVAGDDFCDIESAGMYWTCGRYKRLLEIFRDVLGVKEVDVNGIQKEK